MNVLQPKSWITCCFMIFTYRTIQNGGKILEGALAPPPLPPPVPPALQSLVEHSPILLVCYYIYHIVRKHPFNQINPHGKNSGGDVGQI